jgi:hypothetical protein
VRTHPRALGRGEIVERLAKLPPLETLLTADDLERQKVKLAQR